MLFEIIICGHGCTTDYGYWKGRTFETYESCVEALVTHYTWARQSADNPKRFDLISRDTGEPDGYAACREVQHDAAKQQP